MASQGPNSGSTFVDDATVGTVAWTNPGNVAANDAVYATASLSAATSHYLKATGFGFAIPTGATIKGIVVEWETQANSSIIDSSVKIVKGGSILGTEKSAGAAWPSSEAYNSYGSAVDLWGLTWTAADINDPTFGAVLSGVKSSGGGVTGQIDHVRITVYYDPPAAAFFRPLLVMLQRFSPLGLPLLGRPVYSSQINVLPLADTLASFSDSIAISVQRAAPSDTLASFSDSIARTVQLAQPADTLSTFSDSIKVTVQRAQPADTLASFSDSIAITVKRAAPSDTLSTFSDSIAVQLTHARPIADTLSTFSDSIKVTVQRAQPADTLASFSDSIKIQVSRKLSDTLASFSDVLGLTRQKALADTLASFSDSITITVQRAPVSNFAATPPRIFVEINFPKDPARFSTREAVLADNPQSYHELNETSGTTATDSSGNGNSASYVGSPTLAQETVRTGQRGIDPSIPAAFAALFGSTSQYVQNANGPAAPSKLTVELVVYPTANPSSGNKFDFHTNTGYGRISLLASGLVEADFGTLLTSSLALPLNQSTHVAIAVSGSGSAETHSLYFDGQLVAQATGPSQLAAMSATHRFGAIGSTSATAFKGKLESLAIFLEELDQTRLIQHVVGHTVDTTPPDLWSDVSPYVRSFRRAKGRAQRLDRVEAAKMELELDNSDRRFEPGYQGTLSVFNMVENPSFETNTNGWGVSNGTLSRVREVNGSTLGLGNWAGSVKVSAGGTATIYGYRADGSRFPVSAGVSYLHNQFAVKLVSAGGSRSYTQGVEWFDAGGSSLGTSVEGPHSLSVGSYGTIYANLWTAPANAVSARIFISFASMLANEVFLVDGALFRDSSVPDRQNDFFPTGNDYLDGDILGAYWEGVAHNSRALQSSAYYPFVVPMRRVRVRCFYPGRNLLRDSSFESEAISTSDTGQAWIDAGANAPPYFGTGGSAIIQASGAFDGSKCVKFTSGSGVGGWALRAGRTNWIPVAGQGSLVVSAYLKTDVSGPTPAMSVGVRFYDHAGLRLYINDAPAFVSGLINNTAIGTSWERHGGSFPVPAGAEYASVEFNSQGANGSVVYIDAVQAEFGTTVSPYVAPTIYTRYSGYITNWPQNYEAHVRSRIQVTCVDAFAGAAVAEITAKPPKELSGARLNRLLDLIGVASSERAIDAGAQQMVARTLTKQAALTELQDTADSELGVLFVDGAGRWTFHDANRRTTSSRSTSVQATFGDGGPATSELPMILPVLPDYDVVRIANEVKVIRAPASNADVPVEQIAADGPSQAHNWRRSLPRTTLLATDAACLSQAQALLAKLKDPQKEIRTFLVDPLRNPSLWPVVLAMEISDRVRLVIRPQGLQPPLQNDYFIEAEADDISLAGGKLAWKTTYATSLAG